MRYPKLIIISLALLLTAGLGKTSPVISIPQMVSDAGVVNQGDPINFSVEIHNKGDQTLKVSAISGCNCGRIDLEPEVAPKSMVLLKYLVQTDDMQGQTTRLVHISSNDPKRPTVNLTFRMNVKAPIWLEPDGTTVINLTDGASAKRTYTVRSSSQTIVELGEPSGLPQYCTARIQGNHVFLSVTKHAPFGRSGFTMNVPVLKPKARSVSAVVTINKGIVSEPASLYLGSYSASLAKPMKTRLVLNSPTPFKVSIVTVPKELTVAVKKIRANSWSVEASLSKPIAKGVYRNTVVLSTNQPGQSTLRIPVVAMRN